MKKQLLFLLLLAAFMGATATPMLTVLGFGPATAHAQDDNDDDQGDDNDNQ